MNNKEPRKPRSAAVSVRIQANTYSNLRKIQDELSQGMGVDLSMSQVIAIVVICGKDAAREFKYKVQDIDEDAAAEAAWREIQEEEAGRIEAQECEWAEDEGRDPAELTSIDVLGKLRR
jgi:isocitrate/isopropylmalate dehydrogenase